MCYRLGRTKLSWRNPCNWAVRVGGPRVHSSPRPCPVVWRMSVWQENRWLLIIIYHRAWRPPRSPVTPASSFPGRIREPSAQKGFLWVPRRPPARAGLSLGSGAQRPFLCPRSRQLHRLATEFASCLPLQAGRKHRKILRFTREGLDVIGGGGGARNPPRAAKKSGCVP